MIETQAKVLRTEGDIAFVEAQNASGCGGCGSGKSCGTSLLTQFLGGPPREFRVHNTVGARAGENVVVGLEEGALLKGSLTMYVLPLCLLFIGAIGGASLAPEAGMRDLYSISGGGAGLVAAFAWIKLHTLRLGNDRHFQPVILRRSNEFFCTVIKEG